MLTLYSIGAAAVVAVLGWNLIKRFASDRIEHFADGRRASSRLVSRGEFIDGGRHVPVSLAITGSAFYYENSDMQASLDLEWIQEVEYEDELVTGQHVGDGNVLRLRCFSQVFEFILPNDVLQQWMVVLPAHREAESPRALGGGSHDVTIGELSRGDDDGCGPGDCDMGFDRPDFPLCGHVAARHQYRDDDRHVPDGFPDSAYAEQECAGSATEVE